MKSYCLWPPGARRLSRSSDESLPCLDSTNSRCFPAKKTYTQLPTFTGGKCPLGGLVPMIRHTRFKLAFLVTHLGLALLTLVGCAGLAESPEEISPIFTLPDFVQKSVIDPSSVERPPPPISPTFPAHPDNANKLATQPVENLKPTKDIKDGTIQLFQEVPAVIVLGQDVPCKLTITNRGKEAIRNL